MNHEENHRVKQQYDRIAGSYDLVDRLIPSSWRIKATRLAYHMFFLLNRPEKENRRNQEVKELQTSPLTQRSSLQIRLCILLH